MALAILAGTVLGLVSAVRSTGVPEPSRSNHLRQRLEERGARRDPVCHRPSAKSFVVHTYLSRRHHLGHRLSTPTKPLRTRTLARARFDHARPFHPRELDEQPARWFQILWLVRAIPV